MGRLIDVDELIKIVEANEGLSWDSHSADELCVRKKYIDNAPVVDESKSNESYWIRSRKGYSYQYTCDHCKYISHTGKPNFCQNCGYKMPSQMEIPNGEKKS